MKKSAFEKTSKKSDKVDQPTGAFQPVVVSANHRTASSERTANNLRRSTRTSAKKQHKQSYRHNSSVSGHQEPSNEHSQTSSVIEGEGDEIIGADPHPLK